MVYVCCGFNCENCSAALVECVWLKFLKLGCWPAFLWSMMGDDHVLRLEFF